LPKKNIDIDPDDSPYSEIEDECPPVDPAEPSEPPAILAKANVQIGVPEALSEGATLKQAQRVDVQVTNDMLTTCYHGIGQAKSLSSLFRGIDTTLKVIEVRRKVLNLEYGAPSNGTRKSFVDPLED